MGSNRENSNIAKIFIFKSYYLIISHFVGTNNILADCIIMLNKIGSIYYFKSVKMGHLLLSQQLEEQ